VHAWAMAGTVGGRRAAPFKIRDGRGNNAGPRGEEGIGIDT
ncbi:hypothetical protein GWI33_009523, partial [Rhynchophorus ferrugineus]